MMMMFVVTPSLDSIEHKFNSKSIKFPKFHKVPTLEAININKLQSEWKERLRNFGVKPPKRGIELGLVTIGTRPKKPSSSRGFACEARGAQGSWGLKTENRNIFSLLFQPAKTTKFFLFFIFFFRPDGGRMGGPTGARWGAKRGCGRKDYLLLKEKTTCFVYVSCKSSLASDLSDTGWM
jgi:hypothetical protein